MLIFAAMKLTLFAGALILAAVCAVHARQDTAATNEPARRGAGDRLATPVNQIVEPAGRQLDLPGLRPQGLALSPDGQILATSGKTHDLIIIDPAAWKVAQRVEMPSAAAAAGEEPVASRILAPDRKSELSYTGLIFSPDGSRIYLSDVNGNIKVFGVDASHHVQGLNSIPLPPAGAPRRQTEIPAGLACSADGRRLYVALNLGNGLAELDPAAGKVLRQWPTGVAPYDVALAGRKIYVSNWGGRRPGAGSDTGPAGLGTLVRVDSTRYIASEGSVTVIDSRSGKVIGEIVVGQHASALAVAPGGKTVVVANAASDTLSVIDTKKDQVIETICARQDPGDLFGASPNALAFDRGGKWLFVCNGSQNAIGVIAFDPGASRLRGLAPAGWYPGALAWDARRNSLYVANIKGMPPMTNSSQSFNSHQYYGSLTLLSDPAGPALPGWTRRALALMRYPLLRQAALPPRADQPPRPVPERVGEPGVFKHVVYIIKENRTYDQILGDVTNGNGDARLCAFGQRVTPNEHKLAHDFVLLDNTYCSGILSADGHQWADSAIATDYMEKSFASFPRSYPDGMDDGGIDALAYSPRGFIWDDCLAHGKTLRDYGEFSIRRESWRDPARRGRIRFLDHYNAFITGVETIAMHAEPGIKSLGPYLASQYIGWDLSVPDVQRAAVFNSELRTFELSGEYPNFVIVCLPNDHTSGTGPRSPTPDAQVADNDVALGRMVEALSHSSFWRQTCIFVIEDDPQAGWDHVSGYRTTAYLVSPYTKRGAVVSTQYNQTSVLRTMELMLGLPPMNQMDATATPMTDCFTSEPDFTPYAAVTNNVPLNQMNPQPGSISDRILRKDAYVSARLPLEKADQCPEDTLNRILWHAMKGTKEPYPAWAVPARDDD